MTELDLEPIKAWWPLRRSKPYYAAHVVGRLIAEVERLRALLASSVVSRFTENETKDVLTALYQDGHVDLVLADRIAALMSASVVSPPNPTGKVTRLEVIDEWGRRFTRWHCGIELSYQDRGRTLKIFVGPQVPDPPSLLSPDQNEEPHPDDMFALVKASAEAAADADYRSVVEVEPSDKGYKIYIHQPGVRSAMEGGIKFHTQHLPRTPAGKSAVTQEQQAEFSQAVARSKARFDKMLYANRKAAPKEPDVVSLDDPTVPDSLVPIPPREHQ